MTGRPTPEAFADLPLLQAIIRGWRDRSVDEGLTRYDIEEALLTMGASRANTELALMQLEVDGRVVCDPGTSQRTYRLRGFPQPLLDELDRMRLAHERLLRAFETSLGRGEREVNLRADVERALLQVEEMQACLEGGAEGRQAFLARRARFDPLAAEALERLEAARARVPALEESLRVETDRRLERMSSSGQRGLGTYVEAMLGDAALYLAWGRAESAVRLLERTMEYVEQSVAVD